MRTSEHLAGKREGVLRAQAVPRASLLSRLPGCGLIGRSREGLARGSDKALGALVHRGWSGGGGPPSPPLQAPALTGRYLTHLPSQQMCCKVGSCKVGNSKAEESVWEQSGCLISRTLLLANKADCRRPLNSLALICLRSFLPDRFLS